MQNTIINLWASPRNISTAILYSFSQRKDTIGIDEPFYATYLKKTGISHPGKEEILASQLSDFNAVLKQVIFSKYAKPYVFCKQMSHHLLDCDKSFLLDCKNIILIRDPMEMIISFCKVIPQPKINDFGLLDSYAIFKYLEQNGKDAIVLNSNVLLEKPQLILEKLCNKLEIPYDESMLAWPAGEKENDGIWAKHWYANVHKSTGFDQKKKQPITLPAKFESLYQQCLIPYNNLQKHALRLD